MGGSARVERPFTNSTVLRAGVTVRLMTIAATTASPYARTSGSRNVAVTPLAITTGTTVTTTIAVAEPMAPRISIEESSTIVVADSWPFASRRSRMRRTISSVLEIA